MLFFGVFLAGCGAGDGAGDVTGVTGGPQASEPTRMKIDVSSRGPQVGEQVPDFSLQDQTGETRTLESIMGPQGAMLVFVRSADW